MLSLLIPCIGVEIFLRDSIYGNNSIVTFGGGKASNNIIALLCLTNNAANCCRRNANGQVDKGEWCFPNGSYVRRYGSGDEVIYRNRGPSMVRLHHRNNSIPPTGIFHYKIPDVNEIYNSIYVGIYPEGYGSPILIESPTFEVYNETQTLFCISIGGPVTTVVWTKGGKVLPANFNQQKTILNTTTAEYKCSLSLGQKEPDDIIGDYSCTVNNSRGNSSRSIFLQGEQN